MKSLEIGDIIQKVNQDMHEGKPDIVLYETKIDRVTKLFAFAGTWKFKREPLYTDTNQYQRYDGVDSHFIIYKLKITTNA